MTSRRLGRHILLVGPMGTGKSTIGGLLGAALGRPFVDSDGEILRRTGTSTEHIELHSGRATLHDHEFALLREVLDGDELVVMAAAAGVVDDAACIASMGKNAVTVQLVADRATILGRIGEGEGRPISGPVTSTLDALESDRATRYRDVADFTVSTDHDHPQKAVDAIVAHLRRTVTVPLGERSYDVIVGPGARRDVAGLIPVTARRAAVVTQPGIGVTLELPIPHTVFELPPGEKAKTLAAVGELASRFSRFGLAREDVVIAVGGGSVTDVAGFAAASYHRGTPLINVATTLLGQIDAAIGGKTGVNIPEGKNLVGAFWQPCGVICDTDTLESMPDRERRSGLGEMAKYAFLGVENLEGLSLIDQVAQCVAAKAAVVSADEREGDLRMNLNYGHTLAHALEAAGFADSGGRDGVDLRHGEAVAIGLIFAARLAHLLGRIDDDRVERHLALVASYGLPTTMPAAIDADDAIAAMGRDKKATKGITFVLDGPNGVEVVRDVPVEMIKAALDLTRERERVSEPLIVLLSGPNLTLLGERQPLIYGTSTLDDLAEIARTSARSLGCGFEHVHSDHEADLVSAVHRTHGHAAALVVNAAALTHYGWSLRDALATFEGPIVELHISNPYAREPWRHTSILSGIATGAISGFGPVGYRLAIEAAHSLIA